MNDLERRFRALDELDVPDLRHRIAGRPPSPRMPTLRRQRRATALAALAVAAAGLFIGVRAFMGPREQGQPRPTSASAAALPAPEERAATVAIAALTEAGLHDPVENSYDYRGVRREGSGWIASFCSPPIGPSCDREPEDAFVRVVPEGDDLVVAEVTGAFSPTERPRVIGYREPIYPPVLGFVYEPIHLAQDDPFGVHASMYWTGAIPTNLGAYCRVEVLDDQGGVVYSARRVLSMAPEVEGARDSNMLQELPPDVPGAAARVVCGEWLPVQRQPVGRKHVLASGTIGQGEHQGEEWRLVVWRDEPIPGARYHRAWDDSIEPGQVFCWGLDSDPLNSRHHGQEIVFGSCQSVADEAARPLVSTSAFPLGERGPNMAMGQVSNEIVSMRFRVTAGDDVRVETLPPPPDLGIRSRFYIAFLPAGSRGEVEGLDTHGRVVANEAFPRRG